MLLVAFASNWYTHFEHTASSFLLGFTHDCHLEHWAVILVTSEHVKIEEITSNLLLMTGITSAVSLLNPGS
jgi:hypothetical protein